MSTVIILALGEKLEKDAFQSKKRNSFEVGLSGDNWNNERCKFGYLHWLDNRVNDALYNIANNREV